MNTKIALTCLAVSSVPALAVTAPEAEVHLLVCGASSASMADRLGLEDADAGTHALYFFETPALELYDAGLILRVTQEPEAEKVEFDVKLRPIDPATLDPAWQDAAGFKCEADSTPVAMVDACRLRSKPTLARWLRVRGGNGPYTSLWSGDQRDLVRDVFGDVPGTTTPRLYGPLDVVRWEFDRNGQEVTLELWDMPQEMIELSTRVPRADVEAAHALLDDVAASAGARPCAEQGSKTRRGLRYLIDLR